MTVRESEIRGALGAHGQEHLLAFWGALDARRRGQLLEQVNAIPWRTIEPFLKGGVTAESHSVPGDLAPAPFLTSAEASTHRTQGEALLRAGKVAAFTVAGGQGTRLGWNGPKGTFPATVITGKPLFRIFAEQLVAAQKKYGAAIPWYIMTSPLNDAQTRAFMQDNRFFGLDRRNVMLFEQGVLPSIDVTTGRLLLEDRHLLAVNPDGHGGSLRALAASGALEDMSRRGVTQISYFQVDNPLVQVLDAPFIGAHVAAPGSSGEMSSKMVVKSGPGEKVGVFARSGGRTMVIEYSDLPAALAEQKDADGRLRFRAGSIAVHVLSVDFVHRLTSEEGFSLPLHRALKKVPCIDPATGASIDPHAPNAIKLETFIFDAIPMARCSIVVETDRTEEFGPIKNATGGDSPATSHALQTERAARWLERTGVRIPRDAQGCVQGRIEISPLSALSAEDVRTIPELPASIAPGRDVVL